MQTAIKQRPILFSTAMVQAILEGRKTMTRRIVKFPLKSKTHHLSIGECETPPPIAFCKYEIGDILWVRETFVRGCIDDGEGSVSEPRYWYRADGDCPDEWHNEKKGEPGNIPWKPSIFMPYKACRLFLRITDIKVERLQDISEEDAIAEGVYRHQSGMYKFYMKEKLKTVRPGCDSAKTSFCSLWGSINGAESWVGNPFVWVVSFEKIDKPE